MSSLNTKNGLIKQRINSLELLDHVNKNDKSFIESKIRSNSKQLNWNIKSSDSSGNTVLHLAILQSNAEMLGKSLLRLINM
jgi:ankyrin repeat protein